MLPKRKNRFTYGDQFDPAKFNLTDLLGLCLANQPARYQLQDAIQATYFEGYGQDPATRADNSKKMAMNCLLSLNAYGLIQLTDEGKQYQVTDLTQDLWRVKDDLTEVHRRFAIHILTNLEGLLLVRLIENIRARGERVTLEYLGEEMNDLGRRIPPNSTYISTMRAWLAQVGVFRPDGYEVNWDVIYDLLRVDADVVDELYQLPSEQKYFLLSYVILLESEDITRIVEDKTRIVEILNTKARRTFAKKEMGVSELGDEFFEEEEYDTAEQMEAALKFQAALADGKVE